jgi:tRNA (Thr-GGU) A37 N-methylase
MLPFAVFSLEKPVFASPGPALNLPEAQTFATTGSFFAVVPAGATEVISGFSGNVRAVLGVDSGALRISGSVFNSSTNVLSVGGVSVTVPVGYRSPANFVGGNSTGVSALALEGSLANVEAVLKNLEFTRSVAGGSTLSVSVVRAPDVGSVAYNPDNQRYYEFVADKVTWDEARCAAKFVDGKYDAASVRFDKCDETKLVPRTFNGLSGYLATVTSAAENAFVTNRAGIGLETWIGGSDEAVTRTVVAPTTDIAGKEGQWRWVDGPEAGLIFWRPDAIGGVSCPTGLRPGNPVGSNGECVNASTEARFNNWDGVEPNNSMRGDPEHALHLLTGNKLGQWNDIPGSFLFPYIIEYGGLGETVEEQLAKSVALNVAQNGPPTAVVATPRDGAVLVSWAASEIVTGALSGYTVTASPGGATCTTTPTSCEISGLDNGTSYTFIVEASFTGGSPSRSSATSSPAIPFVVPAPPPAPPSSGPAQPAAETPSVVPPSRVTQTAPTTTLTPVCGPVLRNNSVSLAPSATTALIGGCETTVQIRFINPTSFSLTAGVFNLGFSVSQGQGLVRQGAGGATETEIESGSTTALSGSGLTPGSTVQVFMPLQGNNSKQLASIPVNSTGFFSGDAVFATRANERPMPIGRQVLQVVSLDASGNQAVLEMTVNIAQGAPAPEINRSTSLAPQLTPGKSIATNAGEPENVVVLANSDQKQATIQGDTWSMSVSIPGQGGAVGEPTEGEVLVEFVRNETAQIAGSGFMPGTRADVWLFSEPTLLGSVTIDENGEFNGAVSIDGNVVTLGEHTLQLQGVAEDGYVRAANLGVMVNDAVEPVATADAASGMLWTLWLALGGAAALGVGFTAWQLQQRRLRARVSR